jgi:WD40 repeat protein
MNQYDTNRRSPYSLKYNIPIAVSANGNNIVLTRMCNKILDSAGAVHYMEGDYIRKMEGNFILNERTDKMNRHSVSSDNNIILCEEKIHQNGQDYIYSTEYANYIYAYDINKATLRYVIPGIDNAVFVAGDKYIAGTRNQDKFFALYNKEDGNVYKFIRDKPAYIIHGPDNSVYTYCLVDNQIIVYEILRESNDVFINLPISSDQLSEKEAVASTDGRFFAFVIEDTNPMWLSSVYYLIVYDREINKIIKNIRDFSPFYPVFANDSILIYKKELTTQSKLTIVDLKNNKTKSKQFLFKTIHYVDLSKNKKFLIVQTKTHYKIYQLEKMRTICNLKINLNRWGDRDVFGFVDEKKLYRPVFNENKMQLIYDDVDGLWCYDINSRKKKILIEW